MRVLNVLLLSIALFSLSACSNRAVYENIQANNKLDCQQLPPSEYDACIERNAQSFEDYKRSRDALIREGDLE